MTLSRADENRQIDLFAPYISDLPLRDQREVMERPFFSLSKKKRLKPIDYVSPNGDIFVRVTANSDFGMATIWDADVLIWASSVVQQMRARGLNDIPRTLRFQPYDLLKTIHRHTGGAEYRALRETLARLQSTTIVTNIRAPSGKKHRQFSWIESWTDDVDEHRSLSRGMSITLADWFYEGIIMEGGLLAIDPTYFTITGGRERWLYRVARKHAGGAGAEGFTIAFSTLFEKSGAEGQARRFKFELLKIIRANELPDFHLRVENESAADPLLRIVRRAAVGLDERRGEPKPRPPAIKPTPLAGETIRSLRAAYPNTNLYVLNTAFAQMLADNKVSPADYQASFIEYVHSQQAVGRHPRS